MMQLAEQSKTVAINKDEERLIFAMQLLGDKTRYKIFKLLMTREQMCVSDIAERLDVTVSAISQHFRSFELVGLVDKQRMGQKMCYILKSNDKLAQELSAIIKKGC
ncbi:MAG: winged helix-turn-helix domain-containing protein [Candidatus Saccharimonadales bacterium]